jgi:large conductance mechanosensitive channel
MGLLQEFKQFAVKGNVIDMAVGIVIGAAFGKIVSSFVGDIIMPLVGQATGGIDLSQYKIVLQEAQGETAEVAIHFGQFANYVIDFVIVAFAIFLVVKAMNAAKKKEEAQPSAPPAPTREELLLTEIRDLLAKK